MQKFTDDELLRMLSESETDRIEFKESFQKSDADKVCQAICAFANDLPNHDRAGVLFIGVKDNGEPVGLDVSDELLRNIAAIRSDGYIIPLPTMTVEKRHLEGADMVVVMVMPSDATPVRYKGRIWIRTGPRQGIAGANDERILNEKRRHKDIHFDQHPVHSATIDDLSRSIFENEYLPQAFAPEILEANDRSYEERLASCRMVVSKEDTTPTVVGLLAIGKRPQDFLPGAYIQFLKIDGTKLADDVIDEHEIKGGVVEMLRVIELVLRAHNSTAVDILSQPTHRMTSSYPHSAFQQILYNAVLHRSYEGNNAPIKLSWFDDRVEIISPGGCFGDVTPQNFGEPGIVSYRNPAIADVLKTFGFVQKFGRGIATTKAAMERSGNPPPEFKVDARFVFCTLRARS
ncbi:RNA-binding domain-containing protein [Thioalkalivibrio sp. HK1]|uniref:RNA-binding domain-containing protein n=1 Tax=Thioalkalivibrio sp. HK1 TaxID=1469245 RepID=UPI00046EAF91|nr:ATP-binding protein [Thioalkalivibrio sp. HK1]